MRQMKRASAILLTFSVIMTICSTVVEAHVQKRFLLDTVRNFVAGIMDQTPPEPTMSVDAKRVRIRIGQTLADVSNSQLNDIIIALDKALLDGEINPSLSKLVSSVRQEMGDTAISLLDTEIGDVIYDILAQSKPEKDVIDLIKVLTISAPFLGSLG